MKIISSVIENFRGITQTFDFSDSETGLAQDLFCFCGNNGSGKTRILQALYFTLHSVFRKHVSITSIAFEDEIWNKRLYYEHPYIKLVVQYDKQVFEIELDDDCVTFKYIPSPFKYSSFSPVKINNESIGKIYEPFLEIFHKSISIENYLRLSNGESRICNLLMNLSHNQPQNSVMFIDDFETHLHPPIQQALLRFLQTYCSQHNNQLFISSHSDYIESLITNVIHL